MKSQYTNSFSQTGEKVDTKFAVKFKKPPVPYKGGGKQGKWFELRLADKTGEMTAKFWGRNDQETDRIYSTISRGDIVHVAGEIQEYPAGSGKLSISIDSSKGSLKKCAEGEYDIEDFVATTKKDTKMMLEEIKNMLSTVKNEHLKKLINKYMDDENFLRAFMKAPAAMEYHQNYIGGLMEHTLNVMKIGDNFCAIHPELDRDIVLTGAFLHDLGKITEFDVSGGVIDISNEGMLVGHIIIGYETLSGRIKEVEGFPKELGLKLLHIILSHHGKLEQGASKQPQFPEAVAVYYADEADAHIDIFLRLKREANTEDSWIWDSKIKGHVYLK